MTDVIESTRSLAVLRTRQRLDALHHWLERPDDADRLGSAREAAHQLSGSLGIFGAPEGSKVAARLEDLLAVPAPEASVGVVAKVGELECLTRQMARNDAAPQLADKSVDLAGARILVVDDDVTMLAELARIFSAAGADVLVAADGRAALDLASREAVDLIVSDINMPGASGFELASVLRSRVKTRALPVLFLTTRAGRADVVRGLDLGVEDYVVKPFVAAELIDRARARLAQQPRPPRAAPSAAARVVSAPAFRHVLAGVHDRARQEGDGGSVAVLRIVEFEALIRRLGRRTAHGVVSQATEIVGSLLGPLDVVAPHGDDAIAVYLGATDAAASIRLETLTQAIIARRFGQGADVITVTPAAGWVAPTEVPDARALLESADRAATLAASRLDLVPLQHTPEMEAPVRPRRRTRLAGALRTPMQILATLVAGLVVPYLVYAACDAAGFDITGVMYLVVVVALVLTGVLIWWEGILSLRPPRPPDTIVDAWPRASAVIAAYLPNEAATLLDTLEAFFAVDYPDLQIILAYNTPQTMPIEVELRELERQNPRFVALRVEASESKAQNINAALSLVDGEFVGVFDADHHPDPGAFRRAWRWLASEADVVQGHNVVRNGSASFVTRTVAVEFEAIYAVSHPGRNRMHDFGIFGGSNGYWRTDLLRATRMRGSMLTEDIDASIRAIEDGHVIVSDPGIISRELATTTVRTLWNQRMRWAQGWFQVSLRHTWRALCSDRLSLRQKFGALHLFAWREVYPWLSLQMLPIVAYWMFGADQQLDWKIPLFVLTSLFTLSVGPGQTIFGYLRADPEIRRHRSWFWMYLIVASLLYTEFRNVIARVAQIKELMGERHWRVTPRAVGLTDA